MADRDRQVIGQFMLCVLLLLTYLLREIPPKELDDKIKQLTDKITVWSEGRDARFTNIIR